MKLLAVPFIGEAVYNISDVDWLLIDLGFIALVALGFMANIVWRAYK